MGKPTGFIEHSRECAKKRPVEERLTDHLEVGLPLAEAQAKTQAARCMDCGIPFCHDACPLGNRIPDFNDLVYRGQWDAAAIRLHQTNNFPEFTGRLCPAPCEAACVLAIHDEPVTIKQIEHEIADRIGARERHQPMISATRSGRRVAVVGSGPAGLAAAQELARAGHEVIVFEKSDRIGGLLRYGIPDFKMAKELLDRRLRQMEEEGVVFRPNVEVGVQLGCEELLSFDAVVLSIGASTPREVDVPGRELSGVVLAMTYLTEQNRLRAGDSIAEGERVVVKGKRVVILGGGDTGADCLGTSLREGALSVLSLEIAERPPEKGAAPSVWPLWPNVFRVSPAHEEGGDRAFALMTTRFVETNGALSGIETVEVGTELHGGRVRFVPRAGSEKIIPADLVLIAAGFVGPERALGERLGLSFDLRGNLGTDPEGRTSHPSIYVAGDARRGASLIVWAIAEGRRVARAIEDDFEGRVRLPMAGGI